MYRLFITIAYRKWLIMAITVGVFALVVTMTFMVQPMYRATAALQLAPDTRQFQVLQGNNGEVLKLNETSFYKTQYEILSGQSLAERVVDKLELKTEQFIRKSVLPDLSAQAEITQDPLKTRAELFKAFQSQLNISPVDNSQIVYVSFSAPDKKLAAQVANTFVEEYTRFSHEEYDASIKRAKDSILGRVDEARKTLQQAENELQEYVAQKELVVTEGDANPHIDSLVKLNQELMLAEKERIVAETALQKSAGDISSTDAVLDNSFIQQLKSRLSELQGEYENKLSTFKPNYPDMVQLRQQIAETEKKLEIETGSFRKNLQLNFESRRKQEQEIRKLLDKSSKQYQTYLNNLNAYAGIKRDLDVKKTLYDSLLARLKEIDVASGINFNNIGVLEKATIPQFAYSPNYLVSLSMGSIIALLLSVSVAGILDLRDGRIKSREDLLGLPLQKSPMLQKLDRGMLALPRGGDAERQLLSSRSTLASLQGNSPGGQIRIISLLALGQDEKHVTFMLNLVSFFLKKKLRVAMLVMDGDHEAVRKHFKVESAGEIFVVDQAQPILLSKTQHEFLMVSLLNVDDLFTGLGTDGEFGLMMRALAGRFDVVLFVSTDVAQHPEVISELDASDMILVNTLKRKTRIDELDKLVVRLDRLPNAGFCILHDM